MRVGTRFRGVVGAGKGNTKKGAGDPLAGRLLKRKAYCSGCKRAGTEARPYGMCILKW